MIEEERKGDDEKVAEVFPRRKLVMAMNDKEGGNSPLANCSFGRDREILSSFLFNRDNKQTTRLQRHDNNSKVTSTPDYTFKL